MTQGNLLPDGFPGLPTGWVHSNESFPGTKPEVKLFFSHYTNETALKESRRPPRALFVLHGMGDHGGRYAHSVHYLQKSVDIVSCLDHRGHGRSEGLRGHVDRFDTLADDAALGILRLAEALQRQYGGSEIHLLAHSMGGHVALRTLLLHPELPLASASITSPFLAIKQPVPIAKRAGARVLELVWGSLQLETGLDIKYLSRDPAVIDAYKKDRLNHGKMTPRFYSTMTETWKNTLSRADGIRPPLQFLIPMADQIVDADVSLRFFAALRHPQKRVRKYEGFYHEPLNEPGKEAVFADIEEWIRLNSRST